MPVSDTADTREGRPQHLPGTAWHHAVSRARMLRTMLAPLVVLLLSDSCTKRCPLERPIESATYLKSHSQIVEHRSCAACTPDVVRKQLFTRHAIYAATCIPDR
jgi:hypothetical protein